MDNTLRTDMYTEAFLPLLEAKTVAELRTAIRKALTYILPQVIKANVYLRSPDTGRVETDSRKYLPAKGLVWKAYQQREQIVQPISSPQDPVITALALDEEIQQNKIGRHVLCLPIQDREDNENIGLIVASLPAGKTSCSASEEGNLTYLAKQVSVCYHLTKNSLTRRRSICADDTHFEALISLCGELHDEDAASLQLKVLRYLEQRTQAHTAFLLLVVRETKELFCQVVGSKVLKEEIRFPGESSSFAGALKSKEPICLEDIPQDQRGDLEGLIGMKLESFLCVPVRRKNSEDLIALACVANKKATIGFTSEDVYAIHQCFQYTATVLTSTLAYQNERKLKIQTQALLHIAKNLFTHLGELVFSLGKYFSDSTSLTTTISECFQHVHVLHESCNNSSLLCQLDVAVSVAQQLEQQQKLANTLTKATANNEKSPEKTAKLDYKVHPKLKSPGPKVYKEDCKKTMMVSPYKRLKHSMEHGSPSPPSASADYNQDFFSSDEEGELHQISGFSDADLTGCFCSPIADLSHDEYLSACFSEEQDHISSLDSATDSENENDMAVKQKFFDVWVQASLKNKLARKSCSDTVIIGERDLSNPLPDVVKTGSKTVYKVCSSKSDSMLRRSSSQDDEGFLTPIDSSSNLDNGFIDSDSHSLDRFQSDLAISLNITDSTEMADHTIVVEDTDSQIKHTISTKELTFVHSFSDIPTTTSNWLKEQQKLWTPTTYVMSRIQVPMYKGKHFKENDLTKLLREIMQEARNLTHAERCSVFLIDEETDELVAKVFDGISAGDKEVQQEIRMPKTQGIAGHVATTGNLLNIPDAYSHPLFYRGIDDSTGFKTRNILCFPIKDESETVVGVAQLCNKKTGSYFTVFDEDIASAFAVYCCISISHSLMYKKVIDAQYRNSLANELMMFHMKCLMYKKVQDTKHRYKLSNELMIYHMQVTPEEAFELSQKDIAAVHDISPVFDKFYYAPRLLPEDNTPAACLSMFEDLGFISRFRIKNETLIRFVLMVKKGYRNPPYHNWMHAYAVGHFCYLLVKNLMLQNHLKDIEIYALFVACLCHDIDHRGTTNSFQVQSQSVLAALYSSEGSVMERHHFAQSMCILNTEGCNIFEHLSSEDYQKVLDLMRDIILATDLAHHLRILKDLEKMAKVGFDGSIRRHRKLLLCLLMTSCDLSDQTKDWNNTKYIAAQVYQEFFSQGDLEKAVGKDPIEMMDREKAYIPDLQINFLDSIALPVYKVLADTFIQSKEVYDAVQKNQQRWVRIGKLFKMRRGASTQGLSMEQILTLQDSDIDDVTMEEQSNGRV